MKPVKPFHEIPTETQKFLRAVIATLPTTQAAVSNHGMDVETAIDSTIELIEKRFAVLVEQRDGSFALELTKKKRRAFRP